MKLSEPIIPCKNHANARHRGLPFSSFEAALICAIPRSGSQKVEERAGHEARLSSLYYVR